MVVQNGTCWSTELVFRSGVVIWGPAPIKWPEIRGELGLVITPISGVIPPPLITGRGPSCNGWGRKIWGGTFGGSNEQQKNPIAEGYVHRAWYFSYLNKEFIQLFIGDYDTP